MSSASASSSSEEDVEEPDVGVLDRGHPMRVGGGARGEEAGEGEQEDVCEEEGGSAAAAARRTSSEGGVPWHGVCSRVDDDDDAGWG